LEFYYAICTFYLATIIYIKDTTARKQGAGRIRLQEGKLMPENFPAGQNFWEKLTTAMVSV
jgi:hypothetical protein